jgi:hypothetical protein
MHQTSKCGAITLTTSAGTPGTIISVVTAWDQGVPKCIKGKAIPVRNLLSATPWRCMREWMYRSTYS